MPFYYVKASFLSSILGNEVSANTNNSNPVQDDKNSQNMALLQPSVSCASFLQDKNKKDNTVDTNKDVYISGGCLVPAVSHTDIPGADNGDPSSDQTSVYVIRKDDSISKIADMFGVSVNTILWANDMKKGDKLVEGDVLIILPISGIEHTITKGQTLKSIAKLYNADVSDIAQYNGITEDSILVIGDKLIVPDAEMNDEGGDKPAPNLETSTKRDQDYYAKSPIKNISGYFINPLPNGHKTQGLHNHSRAIDMGASKGTPIHASASGTVLFAKAGYNGGYGNLVIIRHPNGTETYYAHQSKLAVNTGQQVSQGQVIGYVGSTGHSTGSHLHFEVRGARNPGVDGSWKY